MLLSTEVTEALSVEGTTSRQITTCRKSLASHNAAMHYSTYSGCPGIHMDESSFRRAVASVPSPHCHW
jgi:hypothetical protein